ncbi:MAG: thioredoxin [Firmicutes bacterium]|nr:thioredoxin [Bacillota bacterium]
MLSVDKDNFEEEVLRADGLVVVDFWGPKCEECLAVMDDLEDLAAKYAERAKFCSLNITGNRRLAISQQVLGLPAVAFYEKGKKIAELTADEVNKADIEAKLCSLLP